MRYTWTLVVMLAALVGCTPSQEEMIDACPDAVRQEIQGNVGTVKDFLVGRMSTYQVEGTARVDGQDLSWVCTPSKSGSNLSIGIRDAEGHKTIHYADVEV